MQTLWSKALLGKKGQVHCSLHVHLILAFSCKGATVCFEIESGRCLMSESNLLLGSSFQLLYSLQTRDQTHSGWVLSYRVWKEKSRHFGSVRMGSQRCFGFLPLVLSGWGDSLGVFCLSRSQLRLFSFLSLKETLCWTCRRRL